MHILPTLYQTRWWQPNDRVRHYRHSIHCKNCTTAGEDLRDWSSPQSIDGMILHKDHPYESEHDHPGKSKKDQNGKRQTKNKTTHKDKKVSISKSVDSTW